MKVVLSRHAGFCVGVRRAIDTALEAAGRSSDIYMLGDIVHNEYVVKQVRDAGVKKIKRPGKGGGKYLLIRAHGAPLSVYRAAEKAGYSIIDATCPMVKEIQRIAREEEKKGRTVIIIGDKDHDEVLGIKGSLSGKAVVIDPKDPLSGTALESVDKASVVVQSTQKMENVTEVLELLSGAVEDIRFFDTICVPTRKRQEDARALPLENDAVVVIGSKTSANTKRLYQISRSINRRTYRISSAKELNPSMFKGCESVGVLAGASTPDELIDEAVSFLRSL